MPGSRSAPRAVLLRGRVDQLGGTTQLGADDPALSQTLHLAALSSERVRVESLVKQSVRRMIPSKLHCIAK